MNLRKLDAYKIASHDLEAEKRTLTRFISVTVSGPGRVARTNIERCHSRHRTQV